MKQNQDYKNAALEALNGNWPQAVIATIILGLMAGVINIPQYSDSLLSYIGAQPFAIPLYGSAAFSLVYLLVMLPFQAGYMNSMRMLTETGDDRITGNAFSIGFGNWLRLVGGMLLYNLYIFLWTLLFVIPGIIKSFSYAMTPYILIDRPELSLNEAIYESRRLMKGRKFDYFYLQLSFIGWALLSIVTLGIGFIWLIPYMSASYAEFYADVKEEKGGGVIEGERVL